MNSSPVENNRDDNTAATTEGYSLVEAKALHELGVRNHGWYMTEAEHRGVLDVLERLEAAQDAPTAASTGEKVHTLLLGLTCAVFFWIAASSAEWLMGVVAGIFLSSLIINLSRYAR